MGFIDPSKLLLNQGFCFTFSPIGALEQRAWLLVTSLSSTLGVGRGWNVFSIYNLSGKSGYIDILQKNLSTINITLQYYTDRTDGTIIKRVLQKVK